MKLLMHICCAPCSVAIVEKFNNDISFEGFFYNPNIHPLEEYEKRKQSVIQLSDEYNFNVNYHDDYNDITRYRNRRFRTGPESLILRMNDITRYRNRRFRTGPESLKLEAGDMPPPEIIIPARHLRGGGNLYSRYNLEYWKNSLGRDKLLRCNTCYSLRLNATAKFAKENSFSAFTTSLLISPYQDHELIKSMGQAIADKHGIEFYYEDFRELYRKGRELSRGKHYYMQKYCGCFYSYSESDHPKKPIYNFEGNTEKNL